MLKAVLPHLNGVLVEQVSPEIGVLRIVARTSESVAVSCPDCGTPSVRRHSGYQRRLADGAVGGRQVCIELMIRRLFCDALGCPRVTFAEQVDGLTVRYGRRTPQLKALLSAVAVALAGRAGERLAAKLPVPVSGTTLLSLAMGLPDPLAETPRVLGVDEFALRKGHHSYGTVLVDCETRAPVDLLPEREAASFAVWLTAHPGVEIICRDRGGCYADGARTGAPEAVQVADLWHVWHNLAEAVKRLVSRHHACLRDPDPAPGTAPDILHPPVSHGGRLAARAERHHTAVHDLLGQGMSIHAIARQLELARNTVRRYARAATWEELATGRWQNLPSILDPYKPYLHQLWREGHTVAVRLHAELRERGFTGSYSAVRDYLQRFRRTPDDSPPPRPPGVRKVTGWITRRPDRVSQDDRQKLKEILARCPELEAATGHVRSFAAMMAAHSADRLPQWIADARADESHGLRNFADGLMKDLDAVTLGLNTPWSSGCVEGRVTDIKFLKRQMAGRAGHPLLRKRALLVAADRRQHRVTTAAA
ncbi:ISL3 family transposase [Streptomyces fuscichromogenes]|uniref:ISL3 family transposase n=1 Tax=Streptomyces fuscichromogenes TaxID=1324013 RepID=UPI00166FD86E